VTLRHSILVLPILLQAGLARAGDASPPVPAPAGWSADPRHAEVVERELQGSLPPGAAIETWSYRAPEPGGQVMMTRADVPVGDPGAFVRTRTDDLRATVDVVAGAGGAVRTLGASERVDATAHVVEAQLEWAQDDAGIVSVVRALWWRNEAGDRVREVRVECLLAAEAGALRPACDRALAALAAPPGERRAPLALPARVAESVPARGEPVEPGSRIRPTPDTVGPILVQEPPRREASDRRPFYVAAFLVFMVLILWWNRRKRAALLAAEDRREQDEAQAKAGVAQRMDAATATPEEAAAEPPAPEEAAAEPPAPEERP
jgi:hypothetical protein